MSVVVAVVSTEVNSLENKQTLSLPSQPVGGISLKSSYDRHGFVLYIVYSWEKEYENGNMRFDSWRFGLRRASVPFEEQSSLRYGSIGGTVPLEVRFHWRKSPIRGSVPNEVLFYHIGSSPSQLRELHAQSNHLETSE